jgi:hypothetical protein
MSLFERLKKERKDKNESLIIDDGRFASAEDQQAMIWCALFCFY